MGAADGRAQIAAPYFPDKLLVGLKRALIGNSRWKLRVVGIEKDHLSQFAHVPLIPLPPHADALRRREAQEEIILGLSPQHLHVEPCMNLMAQISEHIIAHNQIVDETLE